MKTQIKAILVGALFLAPFSVFAASPTPQQTIALQNELISLLEQEIQLLEAPATTTPLSTGVPVVVNPVVNPQQTVVTPLQADENALAGGAKSSMGCNSTCGSGI